MNDNGMVLPRLGQHGGNADASWWDITPCCAYRCRQSWWIWLNDRAAGKLPWRLDAWSYCKLQKIRMLRLAQHSRLSEEGCYCRQDWHWHKTITMLRRSGCQQLPANELYHRQNVRSDARFRPMFSFLCSIYDPCFNWRFEMIKLKWWNGIVKCQFHNYLKTSKIQSGKFMRVLISHTHKYIYHMNPIETLDLWILLDYLL